MITWLESFNRHFSERNMAFVTPDGEALGYIRTIWSIINKETRQSEDIPDPERLADVINPRPCPIEKFRRMRPVSEPEFSDTYRFRYCDTDFNRHAQPLPDGIFRRQERVPFGIGVYERVLLWRRGPSGLRHRVA